MPKVENAYTKVKNVFRSIKSFYLYRISVNQDSIIGIKTLLSFPESTLEKSMSKSLLMFEELLTIYNVNTHQKPKEILLELEKTLKTQNEKYEKIINTIKKMINCFNNDHAINLVEDFMNFISVLAYGIGKKMLSVEEAAQVLGSAIYYNFHSKKSGTIRFEDQHLVDALGPFFNIDGTPNKNISSQAVCAALESLMYSNMKFIINHAEIVPYTVFEFADDLQKYYASYFEKFQTTRSQNQTPSQFKEPNVDYEAQNLLKQYYKNGEIIKVPENMDEFLSILKRCNLLPSEEKRILDLIEEAKSQEEYSFLSESERKVVQNIQEYFNSLKPYETAYYSLKKLLEELHALKDFYAESEIDFIELKEIKDELINSMIAILDSIPKDYVPRNNLIFLTSPNSEIYFAQDISAIDKGIRKQAVSLLEKINLQNSGNFRPVKGDQLKNGKVLEVYNGKARILFKELVPGTYLILGSSIVGESYNKITNRLNNVQNQEYIEEVLKSLNDPNQRNDLLKEHENIATSFNNSVKRERKSFKTPLDNN